MPYLPGKLPALKDPDAIALAQYLEDELQALASGLIENVTEVAISPIFAAPKKPREGMVVYADGTLWNPGSGEGLYVYSSGGTWIWLEDNPAVPQTVHVLRVSLGTQVAITNSVFTKVNFDTVDFDTGSFWDAANHRIKPTVSGYYRFSWTVYAGQSTGALTRCLARGFKNALTEATGSDFPAASGIGTSNGSVISFMNGSTDTFEVQAFVTAATSAIIGLTNGNFITFLTAEWLRA